MFYVVSPPEGVNWSFNPDLLAELLKRDWPGIEVSSDSHTHDAFDVTWRYIEDGQELDGSQERAGQAQYLEGPRQLVAKYVAWWRRQVGPEQPLTLYDEGYSTVIPLPPEISADAIFQELDVSR